MSLKQSENNSGIIVLVMKYAQRYKHFIKYALIGITGVTLDMILYYVLNTYTDMHYQIANLISVSLGISNNFILNALLNFKVKDRLTMRFIQFYSVGLFGLLISAGLLYWFIEILCLNEMLSKAFTIGIVTLIQFNLNKIITFKGYDK